MILEILPQTIIFAIIASSVYALLASGLTLTFGTLQFINMSHAEMATIGAFLFFTYHLGFQIPLILAVILAAITTAIIALLIEKKTFKPVRDRHDYIPFIISIGVGMIAKQIITLFYGTQKISLFSESSISKSHQITENISITNVQILTIASAVISIVLVTLFLKKTRTGKAIRAVADNKEVAAIMGINVNKHISIIFAIGAALAAIAGIMIGFEQNIFPEMNNLVIVKAFAAIVVGGLGSYKGAVIGAMIIGFTENILVGLTPIPNTYKEMVVFAIIITMLLIHPYGIYGGKKEELESR
jgi:branched-chain amino acid transport system permease protein